ncbi:nucleoid-associated protein [Clostridium akagii]|uniref:nucleoid-associated protein n=1 Tax=Clostridium akagii TaxID=91623 RepID=UPI00047DCAC5|nr:nucleoid-associated protein [Clostridium akagii]
MEYVNEVNINAAVINILDSNSNGPVCNDYELKLVDEIYEYILKHVQKCLKDEDLKYAVFNNKQNTVNVITQKYFNGEIGIVEVSKNIATELFCLMKSDNEIPSCDLISVSISTEYGLMFAILKLDYAKNYTHAIDFVEGKIEINIISQFGGLPGTQRIQKCAFIKPTREENKFDLMVIDRQGKNKTSEEYEANYFMKNFLQCTSITNERDSTKKLLSTTERWIRDNLKDNAAAAEIVRTSIKKKLKEEDSIDIKELAQELFSENEVAENFIKYSKERGITEEVEIDKDYIAKKFQKVRLKINNDFDLAIDEDAYNDKQKFQVVPNTDGTVNLVINNVKNYTEK